MTHCGAHPTAAWFEKSLEVAHVANALPFRLEFYLQLFTTPLQQELPYPHRSVQPLAAGSVDRGTIPPEESDPTQ